MENKCRASGITMGQSELNTVWDGRGITVTGFDPISRTIRGTWGAKCPTCSARIAVDTHNNQIPDHTPEASP